MQQWSKQKDVAWEIKQKQPLTTAHASYLRLTTKREKLAGVGGGELEI